MRTIESLGTGTRMPEIDGGGDICVPGLKPYPRADELRLGMGAWYFDRRWRRIGVTRTPMDIAITGLVPNRQAAGQAHVRS